MPATIHPQFKKDVEHYYGIGFTAGQVTQILTDKYGKKVKLCTVDSCILRNEFKKGKLKAKNIK